MTQFKDIVYSYFKVFLRWLPSNTPNKKISRLVYTMNLGNKLGIPPNRFGNKLTPPPNAFGNKSSFKTQVVRSNYNFTDKPKQSELEKANQDERLRQTHRRQG